MGVLIALSNGENILLITVLAILLNCFLLFMYSLTWLPNVWANETYLTSTLFGFRKVYDYHDLKIISKANYRFGFIFKNYYPIKLTFKNQKTLIFTPKKYALEYLLNIIEEKSLKVRVET